MWRWVLLWAVLLAGAIAFWGVLGLRLWRRARAAQRELGDLVRTVDTLRARVEQDPWEPQPASTVSGGPVATVRPPSRRGRRRRRASADAR
ncbi:MAG: hypothetical protein M3Q27_05690 [Actinomycetota bacterium]|nr:hypothetical protein [Actinomycetota bacterium]